MMIETATNKEGIMRIKETKVYTFNELSDESKERAREWYRDGALDYEWWDCTYEDAERIGLKITGFDLDRNKHVEGKLVLSLRESIDAIMKEHGEKCDTHILAREYAEKLKMVDEESEDELDTLTEEYTYALCEEYASLLQQEYEYLMSDDCVDETIQCNEYEFLENGKRA
jgi:hypothetical protein